jgi:hypothetical protein
MTSLVSGHVFLCLCLCSSYSQHITAPLSFIYLSLVATLSFFSLITSGVVVVSLVTYKSKHPLVVGFLVL